MSDEPDLVDQMCSIVYRARRSRYEIDSDAEPAREEARLGIAVKKALRANHSDADGATDAAPMKTMGGKKSVRGKKSTEAQGSLFLICSDD